MDSGATATLLLWAMLFTVSVGMVAVGTRKPHLPPAPHVVFEVVLDPTRAGAVMCSDNGAKLVPCTLTLNDNGDWTVRMTRTFPAEAGGKK